MRALSCLALLVAIPVAGCGDEPPATVAEGRFYEWSSVDWPRGRGELDLLIVIDNSPSMAERDSFLEVALPRLTQRLMGYECHSEIAADASGGAAGASNAGGAFAPGEEPLNSPDLISLPEGLGVCRNDNGNSSLSGFSSVHLGVLTTSLGAFGGKACSDSSPENDHAHLLPTVRDGLGDAPFLSFELKDGFGALAETLQSLGEQVRAVGHQGCGYEAPIAVLERFLLEPAPPKYIDADEKGRSKPRVDKTGAVIVDTEILRQRIGFRRSGALLMTIVVTDEDDCSFPDDGEAPRFLTNSLAGSDPPVSACRDGELRSALRTESELWTRDVSWLVPGFVVGTFSPGFEVTWRQGQQAAQLLADDFVEAPDGRILTPPLRLAELFHERVAAFSPISLYPEIVSGPFTTDYGLQADYSLFGEGYGFGCQLPRKGSSCAIYEFVPEGEECDLPGRVPLGEGEVAPVLSDYRPLAEPRTPCRIEELTEPFNCFHHAWPGEIASDVEPPYCHGFLTVPLEDSPRAYCRAVADEMRQDLILYDSPRFPIPRTGALLLRVCRQEELGP